MSILLDWITNNDLRKGRRQIFLTKTIGFHRDKAEDILKISHHLEQVKNATIRMEFPETNTVHCEDLPNLKSFSSGNIVEWPYLENLILNHCPNLKKFGFGKIKESRFKSFIMENEVQHNIDTQVTNFFESWDDELSTITKYEIGDNEELRKILDNLRPSHFTNLLLFQAKNCDDMLVDFLVSLMKRSNKLEVINIQQCNIEPYLFYYRHDLILDEDRHGIYFTQMRELKLIEIYMLIEIWPWNPTRIFGLENLQLIHIKSCPSLIRIFYYYATEKLHQLNELKLEACVSLIHLVYSDFKVLPAAKFPSLTKVELKSLSRLNCFYIHGVEFPILKTLTIEKCPQLTSFTNGFATANAPSTITDGKSFFELNELTLRSCYKLVVVVSSKTLQELRKLKKLIVSDCMELKMLFNIDGTISHSTELLQQLDELILNDLPNLTQIINKEIVKFYQNLKILQVKNCESLEWLPISQVLKNMEITNCTALHKIMIIQEEEGKRAKFSNLEKLKIENCPSLKTLVEESNEEKDHPELDNSNYFFPNSLSLDKLKVLYVMNQPVEELWHYNYPSESFCELENLTLRNNKKLLSVFSPAMIVRFNKLKKLTLEKCELLAEVFILEGDKPNHDNQEMLPQLRVLAMSNLSNLTCFWNKEPQVPFFLNLVSLFIIHCHCLKSLFSLSQAQNLKKLKILRLCNCEKVEEVISSDKGEMVATIFPKMKCLVLKDLPKLVNFCQEGGCSNWPNLQTVRVNNIPSMKTFLRDDLNTPLLKSVYITFAKKLWVGNLNKTISCMHNNPGMTLQGRI
ncbi:uncharacterized protein LOC109817990 [Cajanus cajan]|uniref:uncharacterized protein LOC109817990 n=1 Tax=Cajanus cajan TaxID=3821 RepID=UPI00098DC393|nr:uncharacterized protein LOC109817990 [Cajanus cajan]XP_029124582.1 uncharacterized protein LOC109817990 [Cajanus cajan]